MKRLLVSTAVIFAFTAGTSALADPPVGGPGLGELVTTTVDLANGLGTNLGQANVVPKATSSDSGRGNGSEPVPGADNDPGLGNNAVSIIPGNEGGD